MSDVVESKTMKFELTPRQLKYKDILNKEFLAMEIWAISDIDPNRNKTHFTLESMQDALPGCKNKPIVGFFDNDDFVDHTGKAGYDRELEEHFWDVEKGERILGVIRESDNIEIVEKDGVHWLKVNCVLFVQYCYRQIKRLLRDKTKKVSVEITVHKKKIREDGIEDILEFSLNGITILGSKNGRPVIEAIPDAHATVLEQLDEDVLEKQKQMLSFAYTQREDELNDIIRFNSNTIGADNVVRKEETKVMEELNTVTTETVEETATESVAEEATVAGEAEVATETGVVEETATETVVEETVVCSAETVVEETATVVGEEVVAESESVAEETTVAEGENVSEVTPVAEEANGTSEEFAAVCEKCGHNPCTCDDHGDGEPEGEDDKIDEPDDELDMAKTCEELKAKCAELTAKCEELEKCCGKYTAEISELTAKLDERADYAEVKERMEKAEKTVWEHFCEKMTAMAKEKLEGEDLESEVYETIVSKAQKGEYTTEDEMDKDVAYAIFKAHKGAGEKNTTTKWEHFRMDIHTEPSVKNESLTREERLAQRAKSKK